MSALAKKGEFEPLISNVKVSRTGVLSVEASDVVKSRGHFKQIQALRNVTVHKTSGKQS